MTEGKIKKRLAINQIVPTKDYTEILRKVSKTPKGEGTKYAEHHTKLSPPPPRWALEYKEVMLKVTNMKNLTMNSK